MENKWLASKWLPGNMKWFYINFSQFRNIGLNMYMTLTATYSFHRPAVVYQLIVFIFVPASMFNFVFKYRNICVVCFPWLVYYTGLNVLATCTHFVDWHATCFCLPQLTCRQPLALLHLSMEIKTVNISGNKQPFLYQYLKVNKKSHFNYLSFNNTSILQNHTLVLVTTGLVIIKKVFDWSVDKIQTNS